MPHSTPYPLCIFCGDKANSREHAIPAWISKRFGIKTFLYPSQMVALTPRKQPISFASHRARIFCRECNNHFKHLEDAVIPFVVPMGRGRSVALGGDSQRLIALWAMKTGMALIAATAPELREFVPVEHRRIVRDDDELPPNSWIGFIPWAGGANIFAGDHDVIDHSVNPAPHFKSYGAVLTFAKLAFKVVGFFDPLPAAYRIDGDLPSIKQFWPKMADLIVWPPDGSAAVEGNLPGIVEFAPVQRS